MKKTVSLILLAALLVACVSVLASCGAPKDAGAEIAIYLGEEVYDLDPTDYYTDKNAEQLMTLLYEPLFWVDAKGKVGCAGARKYKVNKEDRTIWIDLKETYWSDEVRVTAADYLYAWRDLLLEPNNANPAAALLYDIENAVAVKNGSKSLYELGVETSGYEITITYREGADWYQLLRNLSSVATSPLRQDIVSSKSTYWSKVLNSTVTNGAFKLEESDLETGSLVLTRNLGYHQNPAAVNYTKNVTPGKLVSFTTPSGNIANLTYEDIENKTVFFMGDAPLDVRAAHKNDATVSDLTSTYVYAFNTEKPLFANAKVRRALSLAIDRAALAEAVSFALPATGFIPDFMSVRSEAALASSAKIDEAKQLLSEVDFTDIDKSFTLTVNDDVASVAMANLVKASWESLGFRVTVRAVSKVATSIVDFSSGEKITINDSAIQAKVIDASLGKRDFDVLGLDMSLYSRDSFVALAAFASNFSGNGYDPELGVIRPSFTGWWSNSYNSLILGAYNAANNDEREEALRAAESLLLESAPIVPVVFNQGFGFFSGDLSNVWTDYAGNFVFTGAKQKNYEQYLD